MKKLLTSLLTMTLLLGTLATSVLAADLETVQEGPFTITNVASTNYYSDGTPDYNCEDYTTITINQDVAWLDLYYYNWLSYTWKYTYFDATYGDGPAFDTTNLPVIHTESNETYTMLDYIDAISDGTIDFDDPCVIPAGSSFTMLASMDFEVVAWYADGTYEVCYVVVGDTDGIATTPSDETEVAETEEVETEEVAAEEVVTEEVEIVTGTAVATAATVLVDGEEVAFDAYEINNNNYFKLRDIAYILSGTEANFEVTWNEAFKAIEMIAGQAYTAVGGEMVLGDGTAQTYNTSTAVIYLDGKETALTAYEINGNNYFKLRDLGEALSFNVSWDGNAQAIVIVSD